MTSRDTTEMAWVPGGVFAMGSDRFEPEEAPTHPVEVSGFFIDVHPVTNAQFAAFVAETGHVTTAETAPDPADYPGADPALLVPGSAVFVRPPGPVDLRTPTWWAYVPGADWRHPWGPQSSIGGLDDHPVVHVTFADALAYADWAGKSLPTEAQWERAARGGLDGADWVWGDTREVDGRVPANVWGADRFPWEWRKDRPIGTTAVGAFAPNGYGLHDMAGNVWEWTTDWYADGHETAGACCSPRRDPTGPATPRHDPWAPAIAQRVLKGGSFLCADDYCMRYRPAARIAESVDTSTCHVGFRCVSGTARPAGAQ